LTEASKYHFELDVMLDSMRKHMPEAEFSKPFFKHGGFQQLPVWKGVRIPPLERSVYDTGVNSNLLSGLDFKTANRIGRIYNLQNEYKELTRPMVAKMINMDSRTTRAEVLHVIDFMSSDVAGSEKVIAEKIQQVIDNLEKK